MKKFLRIALLLAATPAFATSYTVKAGGGGSFTTIQACANATVAGDTCTVFAGTYNETPTISTSGTSGNLITYTVNAGDTVNVYGFDVEANYVTVNGFTITDPTLTHSLYGVDIPNAQNHIAITNNTITAVGANGPCIMTHGSGLSSFITITGNTISWCSAVSGQPNANASTGIEVNGDHFLVQNNRISHTTNGISGTQDHTVIRNNTWGPVNDAVDFPGCHIAGGCDTHADFAEIAASSSSNGYLLMEGNNENNILGTGGAHFYIVNSTGTTAIDRFNTQYEVGSGYLGNNGVANNFSNWKQYNDTILDNQVQQTAPGGAVSIWANGPNGAFLNNLMYNDVFPAGAQSGYYLVDAGSSTGFVSRNNLAYDATCSPETLGNCTTTPFSTATGSIYANPLLVATDGSNFGLQAGSPALAAGTYLTTVASGDSGSGTSLVVNDANFFQDGWGIVTGDCVSVTTAGNHACVSAINYSTNTLTLASSVTRSSGDHIWLYSDSSGRQVLSSAPNVGASVAQTWYVGPDGGTRYSSNMTSGQCDGLADVGYSGTGVNQHCRFNDVRYLWQDGSYNIPATFPSWGWVGAGGDTYMIDCSGAPNASCRIGWQNPNTAFDAGLGEYRGLQGDAFNSGAPPPFSGTSGAHTRILGKNYAACTTGGAKTKLNGGYGVNFAMSLVDTDYVDVQCLDITDSSSCTRLTGTCSTSPPLSDYINIAGIQLYKTSTHDTLTDIYIHGTAKNGLFGSTGDGTSLTRVTLSGNPYTGWDADPADGTTGTGNLSLTNFHTLFSGCEEVYPITTTTTLAIEDNQTITVGQVGDCHDQTHGGQGDGIGTATVTSSPAWHVTVASSTAAYNTQDGFDLLHLQGNGSSLVLNNSLAYGNMGQQIKSGALSDVYSNLIVANVNAWRTLPGQAAGANSNLSDYGRAGDTGVLIYVQDGTTTRFAYNTLYSANAVALEIGNNGCTVPGTTCLLDYEDNVFVGFVNNTANGYPGGGNGQLPNLNYVDSANPFLNTGSVYSHNTTYNGLNPCPYTAFGETNALCTSPGLNDQTWHLYGIGDMQIASTGSSIYQAGMALGGITTDYLGTSRLSPPSEGAFELGGGTPTAATPTFSPVAGTYATTQSVTISTTSGTVICYTTNGTTPATDGATGCTTGTLYSGAVSVSVTTTIKAIAGGTGFLDSGVGTAAYVIAPAAGTPTFSPVAGTYTSAQSVTISSTTAGATLCYTTDGTTPTANGSGTCTHGTTYSTAVSVGSSLTLKAIASKSGNTDSSVGSAAYVITGTVATPTASPVAGTYSSAQTVTLSDATSGAAIHYTLDGTTPTSSSPLYTAPLVISSTTTVKAIGTKATWADSAVLTALYTINLGPTTTITGVVIQGVTIQ